MTQPNATEPNRCTETCKDGRPCAAPALEDGRCFAHSERTAEARTAARRRGGVNSAKSVRLRGLVPPRLLGVYQHLEEALSDVHAGTLDPKIASAMAALARAMVTVLTAGELESRVRELEARADASNRPAA